MTVYNLEITIGIVLWLVCDIISRRRRMDAKMTIIVISSFRIRLKRAKMRKLSLFRHGLACAPTNTKSVEEVEYLFSVNSLFSSETAEWNSTKFARKHDLNALYQVCVSRVDRKKKMAATSFIKSAFIFVGNQHECACIV